MLSPFDWIRRCTTGPELLGTISYLAGERSEGLDALKNAPPASPFSADRPPCERCKIYQRQDDSSYCKTCSAILDRTEGLGRIIRNVVCLWGFVSELPWHLNNETCKDFTKGVYIHDQNRFLLIIQRRGLRKWLEELLLYHGSGIKGLIQIFPTKGPGHGACMGDVLCKAIHHEANFSMDMLRIRFYSSPLQIFKPHLREKRGMLTFSGEDFLSILNMGVTFRRNLRPDEQIEIRDMLLKPGHRNLHFQWGRLLGRIDREAKDMLEAWSMRHWPRERIFLLYEVLPYVDIFHD